MTEVLLCTEQGSTTNYSNLSYSNVTGDTSVGTFTQGVATVQGVDAFSTNNSINTCTYEFLEAGIFVIEFNSYAGGYHNFSSMTLHPNNQAAPAESLTYFGLYAQFSRKPKFVLRNFAVGDVVKFFTGKDSIDIPGFSRIRISKLT